VAVAAERDADPSDTRSAARRYLGRPWDASVVAAFGGSLGAMRLNEAVLGLAVRWSDRGDVAIYHVVGARNAEWAAAAARELLGDGPPTDGPLTAGPPTTGPPTAGPPVAGSASAGSEKISYVQVPYEDHMELVYAAADIAVCRAGANTVAELTVTGTPAILVPLPGAPGDHQTANARVLESRGAGIVIRDDALDADRLADELDGLFADRDRLESMSKASRGLGIPDAADRVAVLAVQHARRARPLDADGQAAHEQAATEGDVS
jgi:UDP-N-acetylglucosamine--N-acetylmuramyl-(pentapeptide) pyrophosphoryl-undecaprenol N-acetylglucosamine transferase